MKLRSRGIRNLHPINKLRASEINLSCKNEVVVQNKTASIEDSMAARISAPKTVAAVSVLVLIVMSLVIFNSRSNPYAEPIG